MRSDVSIVDNKISIGGVENVFRHSIAEVKQVRGLFIIRLAVPTNTSLELADFSNVYCVDVSGQIKWQIQNIKSNDAPEFQLAPIVLLSVDGDELFLTDFMGRRYEANLQDGGITLKGISK